MTITPGLWPIIGVVGAIGAIARYTVDKAIERRARARFPVGTLVVNLSGAVALGLLHGLGVGGTTALLAGTAGLGAYTTFSTLIFESTRLLEEGDLLLAAANVFGSAVLGLDAAVLGWAIGGGL